MSLCDLQSTLTIKVSRTQYSELQRVNNRTNTTSWGKTKVKVMVRQKFWVRRLAVTIRITKGLKLSTKTLLLGQLCRRHTHFQEMEKDKLGCKQTGARIRRTKAKCKTRDLPLTEAVSIQTSSKLFRAQQLTILKHRLLFYTRTHPVAVVFRVCSSKNKTRW